MLANPVKKKKGVKKPPVKEVVEEEEQKELGEEFAKKEDDEDQFERNKNDFYIFNLTKNKRKARLDFIHNDRQAAAWQDEDDENVVVNISNVARLRKLRKNDEETEIGGREFQNRAKEIYNKSFADGNMFKWASKVGDVDEMKKTLSAKTGGAKGNLERLLADNTDIIIKPKDRNAGSLPQNIVSLKRVAKTTSTDKINAVVNALAFHENSQLLAIGGYDKVLKLFSLTKNQDTQNFALKNVKSYHLKGLPIEKAVFLHRFDEILACGMKKFVLGVGLVNEKINKYSSTLFTAKFDQTIDNLELSRDEDYIALSSKTSPYIEILDSRNKQLAFEFKMNEYCHATSFSNDSKFLYTVGDKGKIYQWDLNTRRLFNSFADIGSFQTISLASSPNNMYLASGSITGIVNIYDAQQNPPAHLKEIPNLTTRATLTKFNGTSEILAIASKWKNNAVRLVHLPSYTVFSNWPNFKTDVRCVSAMEFSPDSKFLCLGNEEGNVFIYNVCHYNGRNLTL